jgi:hypothetical protein
VALNLQCIKSFILFPPQMNSKTGEIRKMRKVAVFASMLWLLSTFAVAQANPSGLLDEWKIYGGYQYLSADSHSVQEALNLEHAINPTFPLLNFGNRQNMSGWNFGVEESITSHFGFVVDAGGAYSEKRILLDSSGGINDSSRSRLRLYTLTGGPQVTLYRGPNFQPFARFLVGGAFFRSRTDLLENNVPVTAAFIANDDGLAYGGGGGADVFFSKRWGARLAVDILRTHLFDETQNNLRATAGLVFRY